MFLKQQLITKKKTLIKKKIIIKKRLYRNLEKGKKSKYTEISNKKMNDLCSPFLWKKKFRDVFI